GVPLDVVERFLRDAKDMHSCAGLDRSRVTRFFVVNVQSSLPLDRRNIPGECALEAGFFEQHRMQRLREATNIVQGGLSDAADFLQIAAERRIRRNLRVGAAEHGTDGGEDLAKFIVEFARNVPESGFLRGDELLREFAALSGKLLDSREHLAVAANQ